MIKKILNDPQNAVLEAVEGIVAAIPDKIQQLASLPIVVKKNLEPHRIGLLIGGGSGHEPLFNGFVGKGLADAAVSGNFFAAPTPDIILAAIKAVDRGSGVLLVYGNYAGDNMNFDIAAEFADEESIETKTIRVNDDIATEIIEERRGIAGDLFVIKIAGAAVEEYTSLHEVAKITERATNNTRSIGVALKAGSHPETGEKTFELPDDEIEIGMGLHGEPGVARHKLIKADELVDLMYLRLLDEMKLNSTTPVAVLVNNLGSTTVLELMIINRRLQHNLKREGIPVHDILIGSFCTTQEMAGFSISFLRLDDELTRLYNKPADSFALKMEGILK